MTTKMLIDAAHPEETRVVVLRGNRVEEFDFESASRRPLRGNIYLAKVTRVEPSLQAAFVDFGGNRHGFLAFSEIHPDYYQIPTADRMALLAEEAEAARFDDADDEDRGRARRRGPPARARAASPDESVSAATEAEQGDEDGESHEEAHEDEASHENAAEQEPPREAVNAEGEPITAPEPREGEDVVEQLGGGGDAMEEVPMRAQHRTRRQYKIQEVIKRRQILLVQVVKEERGTKGAALTTYLSLAGRYSVLMPNTARGGGISRKITNVADRKRLKTLAAELEVPDGMGVILRTAGASRTKVEVKRDFEYLMRLWESVRSLTLESTAPALVYEEGSLIKRAIRDLYSKDIEDILVAGDEAYREAKDFMRMLMPSHIKVVQPYREATPLFSKLGVESQLDAMFSTIVTLKSGGYIVINQTEALVSIDVNSGRSTREHNIEDTALKTNLEAAEEVARQLRLRDLAGLVVIDFIDMEEKRNNKAVERKLNECLENDRARIQVGRISHFGLLEMSRQRIRTGVLESSTTPCPHCAGTGLLRSTPSLALHVLRALEDTLLRSATHDITLRTRMETAFYILNQKRESLTALEARFGVVVTVVADGALTPGQHFIIERGDLAQPRMLAQAVEGEAAPRAQALPGAARVIHPSDIDMDDVPEEAETEAEDDIEAEAGEDAPNAGSEDRKPRRRRRRRGGRGGEGREPREASAAPAPQDLAPDEEGEDDEAGDSGAVTGGDDAATAEEKRRRRRRRGGRRNRRDRPRDEVNAAAEPGSETAETMVMAEPALAQAEAAETSAEAPVKKPRRGRTRKTQDEAMVADAAPEDEALQPVAAPAKPARAPRSRKAAEKADPLEAVMTEPAPEAPIPAAIASTPVAPAPATVAPEPEPEVEDPNRPKRTGWWGRAKQAFGG